MTYKVMVDGGVEGLEFFDLRLMGNGNSITLKLKKDDLVPVDNIQPEMFQNSLKDGCLGRAIKAGWVKEIKEGEKETEVIIKAEEPSNPDPVEIAEIAKRNYVQTTTIEPGSVIVDTSKPKVEDTKAKINYDYFLSLKHASRLSFISKCEDKALLEEINKKSDSKQLKNNSKKRLDSLK